MSRPQAGSLRVVAGELGGRRFDAPPGRSTRPTSDRVRQAVFNALESMDAVDGARVLDAFGGSGALGIEALSRGASHVTFTETDRDALEILSANLRGLGLTERSTVMARPALSELASQTWDLVLLDPPYAFDGWSELLGEVAANLSDDAVVVIESDHDVQLAPPLIEYRVKRYGSTVIKFAVQSGATT